MYKRQLVVPLPPPRVSLMVLTSCARVAFASLAIRLIARQTFPLPQLEVVLVADTTNASVASLTSGLLGLDAVHRLIRLRPRGARWAAAEFDILEERYNPDSPGVEVALTVRLVHLDERASIGAKRTAGLHAAHGEVVMRECCC